MNGTRFSMHSHCLARTAAAAAALLLIPAAGLAQEAMPHFPNGATVVLVPVQSTAPLVDGSWPGAARTEESALRAMDAELEFAFGELRAAEDWILPSELEKTAQRNPTLGLKPDRLAYSPLLVPIDDRKYIPEPLHTELRTMAALYDTRYVVVPLRITVEEEPTDDAKSGAEVAYAGGDAVDPIFRAWLLVAMVDVRRSDVLWLGEIAGEPGPSDSGSLLATLANQVANQLTP